jgi:CRP-like cAMP-binding protein
MIATAVEPQTSEADADAARYVRQLVHEGTRVRLPALFGSPRRGAIYHLPQRHGITVTALPTSELRRGELTHLLRFRLAQYLAVGFIDPAMVYEARLRHEPPSAVNAGDIHLVAGLGGTGEVMAYSIIEAPPPVARGTRMRSTERQPFPVEQVHGHGIYNRLPILPDLPVDRVRELGRFVKNHRRDGPREQVMRAVVEIGVAMFRVVTGPLMTAVDALVGDLEEEVAKQNLDFFHVPLVVIHGTVPYEGAASYLHPRYERCTVYPFACLISDVATGLPRLDAIERALARPGKLGMLSFLGLKGSRCEAPCMLEPLGGGALAHLRCDQESTDMPARADLLGAGARLRSAAPFRSLSTAEAALVATLMESVDALPGEQILRQGESDGALYLIERGEVDVHVRDDVGRCHLIGSLGPGACCGHVSLLTGGESPADVVARTPVSLLRLTRRDYQAHLVDLTEVEQALSRAALEQLHAIDCAVRRAIRERKREHTCDCGAGCACGQPPDAGEGDAS